MKKVLLLLFVAALFVAGAGLWAFYAPNTPDFEGRRGVKLPPGSGFRIVSDSLESAGVLSRRFPFEAVAFVTGWYRQLQAGYYEFESGASNRELLNRIRRGEQTPLRLTIPPGVTPDRVARAFERDLEIDSAAFRAALRDDALLADLGTDSLHLFGSMLPETYFFYWGVSAEQAVRRVREEFERFFTDDMRRAAEQLNLTVDEVVRLASIVEWEARLDEEKPRIAGVYLNRLRRGMPLQADPTVQYALMQHDGGPMRRLLYRDYEFEHPFNTYLYAGLPPAPINNPSPSALRAVLDAEDHDYLYFVADGSGGHTFSRTLREHNRAAASYRELMRERRREQARQAADESS